MALAVTEPTPEILSTSNTSTYSFAAFTPVADALYVVFVFSTGTNQPGSLANTGTSMTWARRDTAGGWNGTNDYAEVYTAKSPSAGLVSSTITYTKGGAGNASGCLMCIFQITGTNVGVRQTDSTAAGTANPVMTFSKAVLTTSAVVAAYAINRTTPASTAPTSWTETSDGGITAPTVGMSSAFRVTGETGSNIAFTAAAGSWGMLAVEAFETQEVTRDAGTDAETVADSVLGELIRGREASDSISVTDSVTTDLQPIKVVVGDSVSTVDTVLGSDFPVLSTYGLSLFVMSDYSGTPWNSRENFGTTFPSSDAIVAEYPFSNVTNATSIGLGGTHVQDATSFVGNDMRVRSAALQVRKTGTPTGRVYVKIYASTGAQTDSAAEPTTPIYAEGSFDIENLTTSMQNITVPLDQQFIAVSGTTYWVSIEYFGGDASNLLQVASDNTAPFDWPGYHKGVPAGGGGWSAIGNDLPFIVYGVQPPGYLDTVGADPALGSLYNGKRSAIWYVPPPEGDDPPGIFGFSLIYDYRDYDPSTGVYDNLTGGTDATQATSGNRPTRVRFGDDGTHHAAVFDGSDDYLDAGDVANLDGLSAITVACAFKIDKAHTDAGYAPFISKAYSSCGFFLGVQPDANGARIEFELGGLWGGNLGARSDGYFLREGEWHIAVGVHDGNVPEAWLWIDGVLQKTKQSPTKTVPTTFQANSDPLQIGGRSESGGATYKLQGAVSRPIIVNRAATPAEVARITAFYTAWLAFTYPWRDETAVAWWDAQYGVTEDTGGVSEVLDRTGNGNTLAQASDVYRPELNASHASYGNKPVFDYAGVHDVLAGALSQSGETTIYFAAHRTVGLGNSYFFDTNGGNTHACTDYSGNSGVQLYNGSQVIAVGHRANAPHIYCIRFVGSTDCEIYIDDMTEPVARGSVGSLPAITSFAMGNYAGGAIGVGLQGILACMGVFKTAHEATKRSLIADWIATEYGLTYTEPSHPKQTAPAIMFERPYYTGSSTRWRATVGQYDLTPSVAGIAATTPYDAGGAPKFLHGTSTWLTNGAITVSEFLGSTTKHLYARVRTTSITNTSAFYGAHAIITDVGQYIGIFVRTDGAGVFEAGFLDYDTGVKQAVLDISHVVDANGAGEFSLQAKRNSDNEMFIRVNDGPWIAGSTGVGSTGSTLNAIEVGGGTNSAELIGEILAFATWSGKNLSTRDSNWIARWQPRKSPIRLSGVEAGALFLRGRYNDTANAGLGIWYNSHGATLHTGFNPGTPAETNAAAIRVPYELDGSSGSPDFEDATPNRGLFDPTAAATYLGGTSSDFSTWAWVRPESITLTEVSTPTVWFRHVIWVDGGGYVGLYLYKKTTDGKFYAYLYCYDTAARTAEIDITNFVDTNGAGEFSLAARRVSGVMQISVNGGPWVTGDTCATLGGGGNFNVGQYGVSPNTTQGYFDGAIFGVGTWPNYPMTDADKALLETAAADLFDPTESAATMMREGEYRYSGSDTFLTAYSETNQDGGLFLYNGSNTRVAMSVTNVGAVVTKLTFYLRKFGSPTGNVTAAIYDDNGGSPGTLLGTAGSLISAAALNGTTYELWDFLFYGGIRLEASRTYWLAVEYSGGDIGNSVIAGISTLNGYSGTTKSYNGAWNAQNDLIFYARTRAGGTWKPERGLSYAAYNDTTAGQSPVESSSKAPDFQNTGTVAGQKLYVEQISMAQAMGSGDCSGYCVVDLDTIFAYVGANMWQNPVIWAGNDANSGLHVYIESGIAYASIYQFIGGTLKATVRLPRTSGKFFIAWRKWKGKLWISCDGGRWVEGDAAGTFTWTAAYILLGYNGFGPAMDGRMLEIQWIGGIGRGNQWLKGAFERAVALYGVPRDYHPAFHENTPQIYLDASEGITQEGTVSVWADQSGNGRDVAQATATMQPVYTPSNVVFEDKPTLRPDGVDDVLDTAITWAATQPNETFVVCSWGTIGTMFLSDATNAAVVAHGERQAILDNGAADTLYLFANNSVFPWPVDLGGRPILLRIVWDGANSKVYANNILLGTFDPGASAFRSLRLFARYSDITYFDGHLAHFSDFAGKDDARGERITKYLLERFFGFPATMSLTAWWEANGAVGWVAATGVLWPRPSMGTSGRFDRRMTYGGAGGAAIAAAKGHTVPDLNGTSHYFVPTAGGLVTPSTLFGKSAASGAFYIDVDTFTAYGGADGSVALFTDTGSYVRLHITASGVSLGWNSTDYQATPNVTITVGKHAVFWRWSLTDGMQVCVDEGDWSKPVQRGVLDVMSGSIYLGTNHNATALFDGRIFAALFSDTHMTDDERFAIYERWRKRFGE